MSAIKCPKITKDQLRHVLDAAVPDPYGAGIDGAATALLAGRDPDGDPVNIALAGLFPAVDEDLTNIRDNVARIEFLEDAKTKEGVRYRLFFAYKLGHEDDNKFGYRIAVYFDGTDIRAAYGGMLISIANKMAETTTGVDVEAPDSIINAAVARLQAEMKSRIAAVPGGPDPKTSGYKTREDGSYDFPTKQR